MKRNYILTIVGLALIALPTWAQKQRTQAKDTTVNRTVVVEQEYNPIIIDASKINVLPKVTAPTVSKKEVEYAVSWAPANQIPGSTMQAYTGNEVQTSALPGYVRVGYGNYGNLDILGNYLFRLTDKDKLNVSLKMDGMNGKLTLPYTYGSADHSSWNAYYYRTRANVDYTHQFHKLDLNVAGNFGLSNFNFQPGSVGKQKFTSGDLHVGVKSTDEKLPLQYRAETNLMFYGKQQNAPNRLIGINETVVRTKGLVTGAINDQQLIGIALEMNNMFYKEDPKLDEHATRILNNRTLLDLNPYYELNSDNWLLHLGANVDFSFANGKGIRVSPDVTVQYVFSDSYILYAKATGGRQVNDLRRLETVDPYAIFTRPIVDTYEQLNARIGFKASTMPGLWFNIYGGYQNLKDDLYPYEGALDGSHIYTWSDYDYTNSYNFYAGAEASYAYKDLFSVSAEATYYNWDSDYDLEQLGTPTLKYNPSLLMKPEFKFGLQAEVHPIAALHLTIGYQYISRKVSEMSDYKRQIAAINNLSLGANYNLFKGISVYARVNNLLNKKYQWYYMIPAEGISFLGGVSYQF